MATNAEKLNIILSAEVKDLNKKLTDANRRIERFSKRSNTNLKSTTKSFNLLGAAVSKVGATMATGALATGMVRAVDNAIKTAVEIANLARVAGLSTDEFQKFAYASKTVGIEQDKLSDILKDVNDKFGDYMATGAGPLADFFDNIAPKVGLTKEAFVGLSSSAALGKYVKALQDAGVNQQEMTFYMEALASDATALSPLLADNAEQLTALGESAAETGAILDSAMIANAQRMQARWGQVLGTMTTLWNDFWLTVAMGFDEIFNISDEAQYTEQTQNLDRAMKDIKTYRDAIEQFKETYKDDLITNKNNIQSELKTLEGYLKDAENAYVSASEQANILRNRIEDRSNNTPLPPVVSTTGSGTGGTASAIEAAEKIIEAYDKVEGKLEPLVKLQAEYEAQQKAINDALAINHISQEKANELLGRAKQKYEEATGQAVNYSGAINAMASGLESGFMSLIDGSESFADSMKNTAREVIKELYRILVVQQLVNSIMGAFGFTRSGGTWIKNKASGGTLQAGTPSLVGENGPELIVPSKGSRILSHADTMKAMNGGGGSGITVVQNINVSTGVQQTVRTEIKSLMPQIAESAKAAVADAKRRGGAYGRSFA